jgi:hypothetical protein
MAMKTYNFKLVVERDEDFDGNAPGWHAYYPVLERVGGSTWGETQEQALKNPRQRRFEPAWVLPLPPQ